MGARCGRTKSSGKRPFCEILAVRFRYLAFLTACLLGQAVFVHADFGVPAFSATVVDNASMLSDDGRAQITSVLENLYNGGGSQYAVLTVPDLGGEAIEQASISVTDQWKLGKKGKDNGVLMMISKADHRVRIEVGQGLEGDLTDAFCSEVIRLTMVPLLREGRVDDAVNAGLSLLIAKSDPSFNLSGMPDVAPPSRIGALGSLSIWGIFLIFIVGINLLRLLGPSRYRGGMGGMWMGGGGFGGGGFGGGGFGGGFGGGGGGGFSGGGASGGW
jgi:uncharacterized protein